MKKPVLRKKGEDTHPTFTESINHLLYHLGFPQQTLLDGHDPQFPTHYCFPTVGGRYAFSSHRIVFDGGRVPHIAIIL